MDTYRILIFDDDESTRKLLWMYFDSQGYEVFTFPHPATCPLCEEKNCPCPIDYACADLIISDLNMPAIKGLDFLEEQINKGCRCTHMALMSGVIKMEEIEKANKLGIQIFNKPFKISEIKQWAEKATQKIPKNRKLSDWFIGKKQN